MFFKKRKNDIRCESCNSTIKEKFSFCPFCSKPLTDYEKDLKNYGLLGKIDSRRQPQNFLEQNFGITDKLIGSIFNSLVKNLDKQFKDVERMPGNEIRAMPNGIKISINPGHQMNRPKQKKLNKHNLTNQQISKMQNLPRGSAKTSVRRLSDKIVYELSTPGVESADDVFVSKLEEGYEIKAIGKRKVYVNSLPINLPIKGFILNDNKLLVEFKTQLE